MSFLWRRVYTTDYNGEEAFQKLKDEVEEAIKTKLPSLCKPNAANYTK